MQHDAEKPENTNPESAAAPSLESPEISQLPERNLEEELKEAQDKLLRTLAEMENLRRRHTRELEDVRKYAMAGFARDLLDVADNMHRAVAAVPEDARQSTGFVETLLSGVELTERTLLGAFDKHGIKKVTPERGEKFDHNRHQAMFEVPTPDLPPGHVADVMQSGWVISDRLLRAAMVGVTKAAPGPAPDSSSEPGNGESRGTTVDTNA